MSNETIIRYRVMCIAENKMVTVYATEPPNLCPNDHPDRSIDHSRTVEADTFKKNQVEIFDPTGGNFQYTNLHLIIPSGSVGDVTTHDFSWPMNLSIWKTEFKSGSEHVGDEINVILDPDRVIGTLTADANIGDIELNISSTAFDYPSLTRGLDTTLDDTVNSEGVGRITGIDSVYYKLYIENPLSQNFAVGTQIKINMHMVKNAVIAQSGLSYVVGQKGIKSKEMPADIVMRYKYTNNNGQAKDAYVEIEYNYD